MTGRPRLTVAEAKQLGQGSAHLDADPTYARWIVRRISPYLSWFLAVRTPMSADAVTLLSIGSGVVGGLLVAPGLALTNLLALVLLQVAYLLDVADGEVARIRGTAGRRGTYLDLIGHVLQNRALYAGAAFSLVWTSGGAAWAIALGFLTLGLATPFGHYARLNVLGAAAGGGHPDHGPRTTAARPATGGLRAWGGWLYRRVSFLWNYPASMNLFSLALIVDIARMLAGASGALAVPLLIAVFGPTMALKHVAHAIRLLAPANWR